MTTERILTCSAGSPLSGPDCGKLAVYAYMDVLTRIIMYRCEEHKPTVRGLKVITLEEALVAEVMDL
jgi:hypothetical protein